MSSISHVLGNEPFRSVRCWGASLTMKPRFPIAHFELLMPCASLGEKLKEEQGWWFQWQ